MTENGENRSPSHRSSNAGGQQNRREWKVLRFSLVLFLFFCAAFIATQVFLEHASIGSPKYTREAVSLAIFSALNFLIILALAFVLARNLLKLYFEHRSHRPGSKFKIKLVSTFIALSFIPVILLSFLAYGLINKSIERWFSTPAYEVLENAEDITEHYYATVAQKQLHFSEEIAKLFVGDEELLSGEQASKLGKLIEAEKGRYQIDIIEIYKQNGRRAYATKAPMRPAVGVQEILNQCFKGANYSTVEKVGAEDLICCGVPIYAAKNKIIGAVVTESKIPISVAAKRYSVMAASERYQRLKSERNAIRTNYMVLLGLATLIILFSFAWFAIYIARRITMPVQALAEGAEQVARGHLDYQIQCPANDELAMLIDSFNRMTLELKENKEHIEETNRTLQRANIQLEDRRRYIETVLQNISTGVISIDSEGVLTTINYAALQMLRLEGKPATGARLEEICPKALYQEIRKLLLRPRFLITRRRELEVRFRDATLHIALMLTPIVDSNRQRIGCVLVLDDLTEMIRAEKAAAWQEVARRLAHEIKNPLTPIQLSAERIQKRFENLSASADGNGRALQLQASDLEGYKSALEECVKTILGESATLKRLIDEFSQFARLPQVNVVPCDLHQVIENALSIYDGRLNGVSIRRTFDANIPLLKIDPEQMKRVFVNLIDNALEAMEQVLNERVLHIKTSLDREHDSAVIEIADSGHGIPRENREDLFLPYFSTRKGGTGLGLAIVRQIIADHKGYIKAEDNKPRGAKIVIELPVGGS